MAFWEVMRPANPHGCGDTPFQFLYPYISETWITNYNRAATNGAAQACFRDLEKLVHMDAKCTWRSFRTCFATCANQLAFKREGRETLGRWAAGSVMPDRYDRASCATELRLRSEIMGQVNDGWRPQNAPEPPKVRSKRKRQAESSSSSAESTSSTPTASHLETEVNVADRYA